MGAIAVSILGPPDGYEGYTYDAVGNRLTSAGPTLYNYNASNELTSSSAALYAYDNNGNTISKTTSAGTTSYTWDFENRLASVTLPGTGGTVTFKYDPFGRRIYKSSSAGANIYLYDGDNIIQELNGAGSLVAQYTQGKGIDEPLAGYQGPTTSYFHADGLSSITSLTNPAGAVAASYVYDSFGNLTTSTGTVANPFQYTGRESDPETGVYYYRARYYDPQIGRFISQDPIGFRGSINFYGYAFNEPTTRIDPLGLDANTWTYGEIRSWAVGPAPNYAPPPGLGDAKASIAAVCGRNGNCADVDGSGATNPADRAAWQNIVNASGVDLSGGGNFMCVGTQGCWFVHRCYTCRNRTRTLIDRTQPLQPSGTAAVGVHMLYFYNDPNQGWCNAADRRCCN